MNVYYADPAQPLTTTGEEVYDLDHDLSDLSGLSVRGDVDHDVDHDLSDLSEVM